MNTCQDKHEIGYIIGIILSIITFCLLFLGLVYMCKSSEAYSKEIENFAKNNTLLLCNIIDEFYNTGTGATLIYAKENFARNLYYRQLLNRKKLKCDDCYIDLTEDQLYNLKNRNLNNKHSLMTKQYFNFCMEMNYCTLFSCDIYFYSKYTSN
jgi:hypothetical protein